MSTRSESTMEKKELYWMLVWNKLFGYIDIKLIVEINKKFSNLVQFRIDSLHFAVIDANGCQDCQQRENSYGHTEAYGGE